MNIINTKNISKFIFTVVWMVFLAVIVFGQHVHTHEIIDSSGFIVTSSEGVCFRYNPTLAWHLGISDFIIFLCYFFIPLGLLQSLKALPKGIVRPLKIYTILLAIFIVTYGITHLMNVLLLFFPIWYTSVLFNWICAIASVIAAIYLWFYTRPTLLDIATNLNNLLSIKDSLQRLENLEKIIDSETHSSLTFASIKSQIELIRMNLNTLDSFQKSIQD